MKISSRLAILLLCSFATVSAAETAKPAVQAAAHGQPEGVQDLKIGDPTPDFNLLGIDGKRHTLADYRGSKILMVAFLSNHCPDSHGAEGRIKKFVKNMDPANFAMVAINPNNPDGLSIDELGYSKYNDGFEDMKKYAAEEGFNFPYLYDGDTQAVAKAYVLYLDTLSAVSGRREEGERWFRAEWGRWKL
jgi:peroxiredoxin